MVCSSTSLSVLVLTVTNLAAAGWSRGDVALAGKHHGPHKPPGYTSFYQRNLDTINAIYDLNEYPNNTFFQTKGAAGVPPGLFNAKAAGRIAPLGNFTDFNQSVEYFFGLGGLQTFPAYNCFEHIDVIAFSSDCPEIASSIAWLYINTKPPGEEGRFVTRIKQVAFWRFDEDGAVRYYDAYLPNLNAMTATIEGLPRAESIPSADAQMLNIEYVLCPAIQAACVGSNQQYVDEAECRGVLTTKPYANFDEVWGDSIACRNIHLLLAQSDPLNHCPHVGPTGGDKCSDVVYNDVYFDDEELFGGTEFRCS